MSTNEIEEGELIDDKKEELLLPFICKKNGNLEINRLQIYTKEQRQICKKNGNKLARLGKQINRLNRRVTFLLKVPEPYYWTKRRQAKVLGIAQLEEEIKILNHSNELEMQKIRQLENEIAVIRQKLEIPNSYPAQQH